MDLSIRLAGVDNVTLLSVLFGNYDRIAHLLEIEHKEQFTAL